MGAGPAGVTAGVSAGGPATARRGGDVADLDVAGLRDRYARRELSPTEVVRATLDLLDDVDREVHPFVTVAGEEALAAAAAAEHRIRSLGDGAWEGMPLLGVPVSVKDLVRTRGIRTTRGSLLHEHWVPDEDAPVVQRLRSAGAVVFAKTTTSEFGWSATTRSRVAPTTTNPWDRSRTAGGSSGGAAAAVATGVGPAAIGTDGAGSVRIPAAFCGVVGLKPSFGRVPYVPLSSEGLSHLGPLTRTVDDAALLLRVLSGPDVRDPFSLDAGLPPWGPAQAAAGHAGPLRIAWIRATGAVAPEPDVLREATAAVAALEALGHVVEEIDPPFADPYPALVTILSSAEAAAHAGDLERVRPLLDQERLEIVDHGMGLSAVDLAIAVEERAVLCQRLRRCMQDHDVLAMATVPVSPFAAELVQPPGTSGGGLPSWLAWAPHTYPFNLTGQPAVSVPAGTTDDGLPVGLQLVGGRLADDVVLRVARDVERARPWRHRHPAPPPRRTSGRTDDGRTDDRV